MIANKCDPITKREIYSNGRARIWKEDNKKNNDTGVPIFNILIFKKDTSHPKVYWALTTQYPSVVILKLIWKNVF